MAQSSESNSDPTFEFAHAIKRDYWLPSALSEATIQQLEFVHSSLTKDGEPNSPLYEIVGTLISNLRSVRQFLLLPFTLAARVMDGSLKPDSSDSRMRILEKVTRSDAVVGQLKLGSVDVST